jgi:anti-sigma factor RsiW
MNEQRPNAPMPPEILAAYVDGELGETARRQVEAWLAEHPEFNAEASDQVSLTPANMEFWESVAPPAPAAGAWNRVLNRIESECVASASTNSRHARGRSIWYVAPALALASMAAGIIVAVVAFNQLGQVQTPLAAPPQPNRPPIVQADDDGPFRVAATEEVEFHQLPENAAALVAVGRHPMDDITLVLAQLSDVEVVNFGGDDQSRLADLQMSIGVDAPMILSQPR